MPHAERYSYSSVENYSGYTWRKNNGEKSYNVLLLGITKYTIRVMFPHICELVCNCYCFILRQMNKEAKTFFFKKKPGTFYLAKYVICIYKPCTSKYYKGKEHTNYGHNDIM